MIPRVWRGVAAWHAFGFGLLIAGVGCGGSSGGDQANGGGSGAAAGHSNANAGTSGTSGATNGGTSGGGSSAGTSSLQGGATGDAGHGNHGGSAGSAGSSGHGGQAGSFAAGAGGGGSGGGGGASGGGGSGGTSNDPACAPVVNLALTDFVVVTSAGPGGVAALTVKVTNTSDQFIDYAGAVLECDEQGGAVAQVSTDWHFGISGNESTTIGLSATFSASAVSGTTVHCRARGAILNATQCPNAHTLPLAFSVK